MSSSRLLPPAPVYVRLISANTVHPGVKAQGSSAVLLMRWRPPFYAVALDTGVAVPQVVATLFLQAKTHKARGGPYGLSRIPRPSVLQLPRSWPVLTRMWDEGMMPLE